MDRHETHGPLGLVPADRAYTVTKPVVLPFPDSATPDGARAAVLRLLWEQRLTADLHRPLDGSGMLEAAGG